MLPMRQRGQRCRKMSATVASFDVLPVVVSWAANKLTEGAVTVRAPAPIRVDAQADFVLICDYTGKEVVE